MISGESRIDAPVKLKQEIQSFTNTAKSIYTTNRLPHVYDSTDEAFFSRWIITNYPNHFPRNDGFYSSLISNEHEIEGLIVASLLALRDLLEKRFSFEDRTKENMELWQKQNNNVYAFLTDSVQTGAFELKEGLKIDKDTLYNAYVDYCNGFEIDAKTKTKFTQELQRLFNIGTTKFQKDGKTFMGYSGIGIKTSVQEKISPQATIDTAVQENAEKTQINAQGGQMPSEAKVIYDNPEKTVICPRCGKAKGKLYEYAGEWVCVDCLNELQHKNDESD